MWNTYGKAEPHFAFAKCQSKVKNQISNTWSFEDEEASMDDFIVEINV